MSVNNNMSYATGLRLFFLSLIFIGVCSSCRYESLPQPSNANTGYPDEIASIISTKCANTGCHNSTSADNAAGIDLSSWDKIFTTGRSGSCVIPFSPEYSYMLYTVNTDSTKGPVLIPTMPYNASPLSASDYEILKAWISAGAPNKEGKLKYPLDPFRKKIYVCMQGCDQVAVIDSKTKNIMKYVKVGTIDGTIEAPHQVRISPDGQYWYVVFYSGTVLQKFRRNQPPSSDIEQGDIGRAHEMAQNGIANDPNPITNHHRTASQGQFRRNCATTSQSHSSGAHGIAL